MGVLDPNDKILTTATARNKKVAEQEASRLALEQLDPTIELPSMGDNGVSSPSGSMSPSDHSENDEEEEKLPPVNPPPRPPRNYNTPYRGGYRGGRGGYRGGYSPYRGGGGHANE
jgi:hypothetical protein